MQRNFEPMKKQVEAWKGTHLPDETAKLVVYRAFVQGNLDAAKHLIHRIRGVGTCRSPRTLHDRRPPAPDTFGGGILKEVETSTQDIVTNLFTDLFS